MSFGSGVLVVVFVLSAFELHLVCIFARHYATPCMYLCICLALYLSLCSILCLCTSLSRCAACVPMYVRCVFARHYAPFRAPISQIRARIMHAFRSPAFKFCHIWCGFNGLRTWVRMQGISVLCRKPVFTLTQMSG